MPRLISIADSKKRDAQVQLESPASGERARWVKRSSDSLVHLERLVKGTEKTTYEALVARHGSPEALSRALIEGNPELDLENVGRRLGNATKVWVSSEGNVLYAARILQVITDPEGEEKSREDFIDVEATVGEDLPPLRWTGRLIPAEQIVRKVAMVRKVMLRHVNGLTFDFLYEMASLLDREGKLLQVGAGPKAQEPLIFQTNGSPFRGFLEGRVEGERYRLVLHLSNLELKRLPEPKVEELAAEGGKTNVVEAEGTKAEAKSSQKAGEGEGE